MFSHDLHAYVRALMGPGAVRVGPFLAAFDAHDDGPYRNYAVPDDGARPSATEVDALVAAFRDRRRLPRLEYLPDVCGGVRPALDAAGFVAEAEVPVLTCDPGAVTGPWVVDGIAVHRVTDRADLRGAAEAQNEAYGVDWTTGHDVDRLAGTVAGGGLVVSARPDAEPERAVGAGLCAPPHGGVSELAAVGVRAAYRRRGIAAAVTAHLTRACADVGITRPFLTPAGADEERIYRRVGYRDATTMLHISRPAG